MSKTVNIPHQVRLAEIQPSTLNLEARTVDVVWTTGASVRRYSWWDDEYYDESLEVSADAVDMSRFLAGAVPVLNSHQARDLRDQIGIVSRGWIEGNEGRATIKLSGRDDVAGIIADIQSGIIRNISVGYSVQKYEITRGEGEIAHYRAVRWMPQEISFVPIGADAMSGTRNQQQGSPCEIEEPAMADPIDQQQPQAAPVAPEVRTVTKVDNGLAADILELAQRHGMVDKAPEWIRGNKTLEEVRGEILNKLATESEKQDRSNKNSVMPGKDQIDKQREAAGEVILSRSYATDIKGARIQIARENPFRSFTLLDMARHSLQSAGVRMDGMSKLELVGRAFTQGTSDFPVLLENVMHKAMQGAYAVQADTWSRWCARGSVSDFRAHNRYRVGSIGNLSPLNEHGEYVTKAIPDGEKSSITADTKGNMINLSRKAIINDDLGAFVGLGITFARSAARTVEADAYALLASNPVLEDNIALFHADHDNLGTSAVPNIDSFSEARRLMAEQMDISGNDFLDIRPQIFLSGLAAGDKARVTNGAEYDPDTANKLQRPNVVRGMFSDIVDTPRIAGNTWYAFADPNQAPVIEVAFLDGQDAPFLDSEEGFTSDGVKWKCRLDFGVAAIDYRGAVRNAGG